MSRKNLVKNDCCQALFEEIVQCITYFSGKKVSIRIISHLVSILELIISDTIARKNALLYNLLRLMVIVVNFD